MMNKPFIKFPYGLSNLQKIATEDYVFVDKTPYVELLEKEENNVVFLRPRRIGKSLFVSILEYYYDINKKDVFDKLFSKYYIGKNPTPKANAYRVLKMDFSGIDTQTNELSYKGFLNKIKNVLEAFSFEYKLFSSKEITEILAGETPGQVMQNFFTKYETVNSIPIYLIIDEYDHFTNEILIRDLSEFKTTVSQNGYVRKFFETIKIGTQQGFIDRFFITGVSPVTLDSVTSGFNIVKHLTSNTKFHNMMGFTEEETQKLLNLVLEDKTRNDLIMMDLKKWYNGYNFNVDTTHTVYNSDMVLYFLDNFKDNQQYPRQMLDPNIMPDYGKLKKLFEVANFQENLIVLEEILQKGEISTELIYQFSFDKPFDKVAFTNLLYYLGNLTLRGTDITGMPVFTIPNYVIGELYWQYYAYVLQANEGWEYESSAVRDAIRAAAFGNIAPFFAVVEKLLQSLSNRDYQRFDEKYIKTIMMAYAHQANFYYIRSEREIGNDGYIDLEWLRRPTNTGKPYEFVFEIKYLKKTDSKKWKTTLQEAKNQLKNYLSIDSELKNRPLLKAIAAVVVKDKIHWEEV